MKNRAKTIVVCIILISIQVVFGQTVPTSIISDDEIKLVTNDTIRHLNIPERLENAIGGSEFVNQVTGWSIIDREKAIVKEIMSGNMPAFSRKLQPLKITTEVDSESYELVLFTTIDYITIGSDEDYLYIPMTPSTAQYLADTMNCLLPTKKIVDIIYSKAAVKLVPQPIPPSDTMTTLPVFRQHTDSIKYQMQHMGFERSADPIIAGHKKDIIISNKMYPAEGTSERVVIYGWHFGENQPIQPVYNGHHAGYADYSHGTRLISKFAFINGDTMLVEDILKHQKLSILLSNEGIIPKLNYPKNALFTKE
ncbi:MAG: hypothetical protein Sapg2KO_42490 [Saprospiraceae bacterium]